MFNDLMKRIAYGSNLTVVDCDTDEQLINIDDVMVDKKKLSKRAKAALKKTGREDGKLLMVYEDDEFCEFVIYYFGDILTYRVYHNGEVYEK